MKLSPPTDRDILIECLRAARSKTSDYSVRPYIEDTIRNHLAPAATPPAAQDAELIARLREHAPIARSYGHDGTGRLDEDAADRLAALSEGMLRQTRLNTEQIERADALSEQVAALTRERDALQNEYESRAIIIARWLAILGYDNADGMWHTRDGREPDDMLRSAVAAEARCAAMERALRELVAIKDSVDTVISCRITATTTEGYALLERVIAEHKQWYPLGEQEAFKAAWAAARAALAAQEEK
jgi:hypothetical protein